MNIDIAKAESRDTREKILAAAEELLSTDRSLEFTLNQIADKLGLHYTAVYHYFKNRDDLEASLIEAYSERRSGLLQLARSHPGNAFSQLMTYVHLVMHESSTSLIIRGRSTLVEPYRRRAIRSYQRNRAELAELIVQGIAEKSIRTVNPQLAAHLVARVLDRFSDQVDAVFTDAGLDADRLTEELIAFFTSGIAVQGRSRGKSLLESEPKSLFSLHSSGLERILRAMTIAFNTRGWRKTSIPEVAKELGMSKTSLYRFAATKEELLNLCAQRTLNLIAQVRQTAIATASNPLQAVLIDTHLSRWLLDNPPGPLLSPYLFDNLSLEHSRATWDVYRDYRRVLIDLIGEACREKLIRPLTAEAVQPMITACAYIPFQTTDTNEGHTDQVMTMLAYGLAGSGVGSQLVPQ